MPAKTAKTAKTARSGHPVDAVWRPSRHRNPRAWARRASAAYRGGRARPLGGYAATLGAYGTVVTALGVLARRTGRRGPDRITPWDVLLYGLATHKLSRVIAKDPVTSPLRAPFTRYRGRSGPAELAEEVRGDGPASRTVGELVSCPFCLSQWVATGFAAGWVFAPRVTKQVAATFATVSVSDFLQFAYAAAEQRA